MLPVRADSPPTLTGTAPSGMDRQVRVAVFMKGFPPTETGGPVEAAFGLVSELLRSDLAAVTLIVETDSKEEEIRAAFGNPPGLRVIRLDYFSSLDDVRQLPRVFRALRAADLVHFNEFPVRHMAYVILAKACGIPTVFALHGLLTEEAGTFLGPEYPLRFGADGASAALHTPRFLIGALVRTYRWIAPHWGAVVANSRAHLVRAVEAENFDPAGIRLIPHGVDLPRSQPTPLPTREGPPRLLFVGKLEKVKGPDLLLDALAVLQREGRRVSLAIVGGGSLEGELRDKASRLGAHNISFHGALPHREVPALLEESDIVVVPSRYESFGIVVLEAMAAGRPLVATAVGGIPEIVSSPRNALLVPADPTAIASAIRELIDRPDLRAAMSRANVEDAASYSWEEIAPQYLSVYRNLIHAPPSGVGKPS